MNVFLSMKTLCVIYVSLTAVVRYRNNSFFEPFASPTEFTVLHDGGVLDTSGF
jgi:hypothetical protein